MQPTPEQAAIVATEGNLKINAVAGSGKTTTLLAYAAARRGARGLYLAFNSTVRREAQQKFQAQDLTHVDVHTAHSLAYRHIVKHSRYEVLAAGSYKTHELVELLKLPASDDNGEYILASHIKKLMAWFCNSDKARVQELNYREQVTDPEASAFVERHYAAIERGCRQLLASMDRAEIKITHDFYLKKFQLAAPRLRYDYILFDEAQDASGSMLDIILRQNCTKIMVGDAHQQIYSWRYAINSLARVEFPVLPLTTSFRFGPSVAELATRVLDFKAALGPHEPVTLSGLGTSTSTATRAVIGRTNLGLLVKAIEYITGPNQVQRLYFEGNINSYTYADEGASLYDVLALYNGRTASIKDPLIRKMANLNDLFAYARQTEDAQLLMLITLVEDYGNSLTDLIKELKRRQVSDGERHRAQVFFSTVHRCKGLEYDVVQLVNDFISREKISEVAAAWRVEAPSEGERTRFYEEINLLYVALTRARHRLYLPEESRPAAYQPRGQVLPFFGPGGTVVLDAADIPPASASSEAGQWNTEWDEELIECFCAGMLLREMAQRFRCGEGPLKARIWDLELEEKYGNW